MLSWLGLDYFGFRELWSPVFILCTLAVAALYLYVTGPMRHRFHNSEPVKIEKKALFLFALFMFYIAKGSPLFLLGHMMFSAHMLSMAIAYLIVPPLVLMSLPEWLIRSLFQLKWLKKISSKVLQPLITLFCFNILFSFYHIPVIHDFVMTNYTIHTLYYIALLIAAFMMWWTIITPLPEMRRLSELQRMAFIFANGVLITPACALIIFAGAPLYAVYNDPDVWIQAMGYCLPANTTINLSDFGGPEYFSLFSSRDDQQLGGVIMKLLQEIMYGGILAYVFSQWYRRENKEGEDDDMNPKVSFEPNIERV